MNHHPLDQVIDRTGTFCNKWDFRTGRPESERELIPFTIADMDFACPPPVLEAMRRRLEHPILGYSHADPALFAALGDWMHARHGFRLDPDWLRPVPGVMTGQALALRALVKPGEKVLVFSPVYTPFFTIITGAGFELVECPLSNRGGRYEMDLDAAERELKDGVKAILFCNPHNPVGRVWTRQELDSLATLCARYGVCLISDEAHGEFVFEGSTYTPLSSLDATAELCVSCVSPNKSFNIPGEGLAFLVIRDGGLRGRIAKTIISYWITTPSLLGMVGAKAGYLHAGAWMDEIVACIAGNLRLVDEFVRANMPGIGFRVPEGTYLAWFDCSCFGKPAAELAAQLTEETGVVLHDGAMFRGDGARYLRMNVACPAQTLRRGLETMVPFYRKYC